MDGTEEFFKGAWFEEEFCSAVLERAACSLDIAMAGEDDNLGGRSAGAQVGEDVESARARHLDVQDYHVEGAGVFETAEGLEAVGGGDHVEAFGGKELGHELTEAVFIIDDEYTNGRHRGPSLITKICRFVTRYRAAVKAGADETVRARFSAAVRRPFRGFLTAAFDSSW